LLDWSGSVKAVDWVADMPRGRVMAASSDLPREEGRSGIDEDLAAQYEVIV
jgi:hypothetical protein